MTFDDMLKAAQGGPGVDALAGQFGLSQAQAQAAVQALLPAFSEALQKLTANTAGLAGVLAQLVGSAPSGGSAEASQAGPGGAILGQIFGSQQAIGKIVEQAAQASGLSAQAIAQMLPAIASMVIGALTPALSAQGLGGLLGQFASVLAGRGGSSPVGGAGDVMGSIAGVAQKSIGAQADALRTGLDSLSAMFQAGVQASQAQQQLLGEIVQSLAPKNPKG